MFFMLKLTQKEQMLLKDQAEHEKLCIEKYTTYAQNAQCPELKLLFQMHAQEEKEHLNTLNELLSGQIPMLDKDKAGQQAKEASYSMNNNESYRSSPSSGNSMTAQVNPSLMGSQNSAGSMSAQGSAGSMNMSTQNSSNQAGYNENDASLLADMLVTEKYISQAYDTTIFENTNSQVRDVLNHIQKEEQQHGEELFKYMQSKGMYNPQ